MSSPLPKFTDADTAAVLLTRLGRQFAVVENPPYVFPPYELYPLAAPQKELPEGMVAAVMDMDGTTTTTEALCTQALNTMVIRMSGEMGNPAGRGIDLEHDYPHIIGNSTTKHVEYLVNTYRDRFDLRSILAHFLHSAAWTLHCGFDPGRAREARLSMTALGLGDILTDCAFAALPDPDYGEAGWSSSSLSGWLDALLPRFHADTVSDLTRVGIEIYYQRYHASLLAIRDGKGMPYDGPRRLIEPMPGVGFFLALLKGWLDGDVRSLGDRLALFLRGNERFSSADIDAGIALLPRLAAWFNRRPARIGLVTSSIATEAEIVLGEVFRALREEVMHWEVGEETRERLYNGFSSPDHVYDTRITAGDSSEIRLKPHRDLYTLALHALGISPRDFHRVAGFEDSEPGAIAIRAAGIPLCCALPFAMTRGHRFAAATHICPGGLPEVVLLHRALLPESLV